LNIAHKQLDSEPDFGGGVATWTVLDDQLFPAWMIADCLSPSEIERCERTAHAGAQERFRRGRILLRNIFGRALNIPPKNVTLTLGEYGKPFVGGIHFNMSHTEGVMILAVSQGEIGVDVETPSPGRDIRGLVNRYFTRVEREQFAALPPALQAEAFLRGWTCKEAVLKALGTGVRDLQNVSVDLDPRLPPRVLECPGSQGWLLECWKVGDASAAVCVEN